MSDDPRDEIEYLKQKMATFQDYIEYVERQVSANEDVLLFTEDWEPTNE